jgi:hypothetical protein
MSIQTAAFFMMIATILWACVYLTYGAVKSAREKLRFENDCVIEGYKNTLKVIAVSDILSIQIAALYNVAPADDLWVINDKKGSSLRFLHRSIGAKEILVELEQKLANFSIEKCIEVSRRESTDEELVEVWKLS